MLEKLLDVDKCPMTEKLLNGAMFLLAIFIIGLAILCSPIFYISDKILGKAKLPSGYDED